MDILKSVIIGIMAIAGVLWLLIVSTGLYMEGKKLLDKYPTLRKIWDWFIIIIGLMFIFFMVGAGIRVIFLGE